MSEIQKSVTAALFERRKSLGFSQDFLANLAGVDVTTISRMERDTVVPSLETLEKISKALGIKLSKIIAASESEIDPADNIAFLIRLLEDHRESFYSTRLAAKLTGQPSPMDTRAWSQIIVSVLTGIRGLEGGKGSDLIDGSDVKAASTWGAIDTPRFNGVIKSGRKAVESGKVDYLDQTPFLFLVLWDNNPSNKRDRCRIWVVDPRSDENFRNVSLNWYADRDSGKIKSDNFQLQPPRNLNTDVIGNSYGKFSYPLLFSAEFNEDLDTYEILILNMNAMQERTRK